MKEAKEAETAVAKMSGARSSATSPPPRSARGPSCGVDLSARGHPRGGRGHRGGGEGGGEATARRGGRTRPAPRGWRCAAPRTTSARRAAARDGEEGGGGHRGSRGGDAEKRATAPRTPRRPRVSRRSRRLPRSAQLTGKEGDKEAFGARTAASVMETRITQPAAMKKPAGWPTARARGDAPPPRPRHAEVASRRSWTIAEPPRRRRPPGAALDRGAGEAAKEQEALEEMKSGAQEARPDGVPRAERRGRTPPRGAGEAVVLFGRKR